MKIIIYYFNETTSISNKGQSKHGLFGVLLKSDAHSQLRTGVIYEDSRDEEQHQTVDIFCSRQQVLGATECDAEAFAWRVERAASGIRAHVCTAILQLEG